MIAFGNCLLALAVTALGEYVGCRNRSKRDAAVFIVTVACVGVNVAADLMVTYWNILAAWRAEGCAAKKEAI